MPLAQAFGVSKDEFVAVEQTYASVGCGDPEAQPPFTAAYSSEAPVACPLDYEEDDYSISGVAATRWTSTTTCQNQVRSKERSSPSMTGGPPS